MSTILTKVCRNDLLKLLITKSYVCDDSCAISHLYRLFIIQFITTLQCEVDGCDGTDNKNSPEQHQLMKKVIDILVVTLHIVEDIFVKDGLFSVSDVVDKVRPPG